MSAKSICHAILFFVAVTLVSGDYLFQTIYEDSSCSTPNGGLYIQNVGGSCTPDASCTATTAGLYASEACDTDLPPTATDLALLYTYSGLDGSCSSSISSLFQVPLDVCTVFTNFAIKASGCNDTEHSNFLYVMYKNVADCLADTNGQVYPLVSGACAGMPDSKNICPVPTPIAPPVAPPMDAPIAPPVDSPVAPPMDAPMAAPVATPIAAPVAAPKAATPAKKSSDAVYNAIIGVASIITLLLVVA